MCKIDQKAFDDALLVKHSWSIQWVQLSNKLEQNDFFSSKSYLWTNYFTENTRLNVVKLHFSAKPISSIFESCSCTVPYRNIDFQSTHRWLWLTRNSPQNSIFKWFLFASRNGHISTILLRPNVPLHDLLAWTGKRYNFLRFFPNRLKFLNIGKFSFLQEDSESLSGRESQQPHTFRAHNSIQFILRREQ